MARTYTLQLRDPLGANTVLDLTDTMLEMSATMRINAAGILTLVLDACDYNIDQFDEDQILSVWIQPDRGQQFLMGERTWLLEYYATTRAANGDTRIKLIFSDGIGWLQRRRVTYASETPQTESNAEPSDNLMKRIMRQNGGIGAQTGSYNVGTPDNDRDVEAWVQVQADVAAAPVTTKAFEHKVLLSIMQELAEFSEAQGTRLYFDLPMIGIVGAPPLMEFRTYVGQRGVDRTQATGANPLVLSPDNETIGEYELAYDYRKSARRAYAGSRGDGGARVFATATEAGLAGYLATHPLALRETFENVSGIDPGEANFAAKLQTEADTALHRALSIINFDGRIVEQDGLSYGVEWFFGDRLTIAAEGQLIDADINVLSIVLKNGRENIDASVSSNVSRNSVTGAGTVFAAVASANRRIEQFEIVEVP